MKEDELPTADALKLLQNPKAVIRDKDGYLKCYHDCKPHKCNLCGIITSKISLIVYQIPDRVEFICDKCIQENFNTDMNTRFGSKEEDSVFKLHYECKNPLCRL